MSIFQNFDLWAVGLTVAAILFLGFVAFYNRRLSVTNRTFLFFSFATVAYGIFNYINYQTTSPVFILWLLRLTLFAATWHAFSFFQLFYVFPNEKILFPKWYELIVIPVVAVTSFLTLTPLVFSHIQTVSEIGQVTRPIHGPLLPVFGLVTAILVFSAIVLLIQKTRRAKPEEKKQFRLVTTGSLLSFSLIMTFNVFFPVVLSNVRYVPLAPVFFLPFIAFTTYAILRHGLLNVKVISTEILTFVLAIAVLFEVVFSQDIISRVYRSSVFLLVLSVGLLLIKSVRKEVEQREETAKLAASLEKANLRLQALDKQKTEFLSIASHQLRTPMSILKGYIELIHDGAYGKASTELKKVLANMDASNERLVKLVDEFLNIARIEQGRTKFSFVKASMSELIGSVMAELSGKAAEKKLRLLWRAPKMKFIASMDEEKIRHVVFNFVDNAIKYTEAGFVEVTVERDGRGVTVRVKDSGVGFGKKDEANFFQKFYRGENVKAANVEGTGLGLYVCAKFIEAHGGRAWCKSEGIGKGSEFGFWIPSKLPARTVEQENANENEEIKKLETGN